MNIKIKTTLVTLEIIDLTNYGTVIKDAVTEAIRLHDEVVKEYLPK